MSRLTQTASAGVPDGLNPRHNALLVERLRPTLWTIMLANGIFAIELIARKGLAIQPIHVLMLINTVQCAIALRALRHPRHAPRAVLIASIITSFACLQAAGSAVIDRDTSTLMFAYVLITVGAAAVLPWGPRAQLGLIAVAIVTAAWSCYTINGSLALTAVQSVMALQVSIALAVSLAVAFQFDAYRRAIEQHNAELAASTGRYRDLAENVTDVIARLALDGTLHYVSPAVRWLGYDPVDLVGRNVFDFVHPDEIVDSRAAFTTALASSATSTLSCRLRRADGDYRWVEVGSRVVDRSEDGASGEVLAVMRDVDERHQAQDAVRRSEQHFRALVENSFDMISVIAPNGTARYRSPSNKRALGYSEEIAAALTPFQLLHPDDGPALRAKLATIRAKPGATEAYEARFRHADGSWHVIEGTATNLIHDPAVIGIVVNSRDITERKRVEAQLQQAEAAAEVAVQHLAAIVECSEDAIVGGGPDGTIMSWNRAAERLYGYAASEVIGGPISIIYPPDQPETGPRIVEQVKRGQVIKQDDTVRMRKDGTRVSVSVTLSPITNAAGTVVGASAIARDITERKRAEVELQQAKEDAEAANRSKSEFLANMSHEIRTPMNGIIGMTELTLNTALSAEQREYLGMVRSSADSLLTVVNDILDFSKVDAGKLELDAQDFKLGECVGETLKILGLRAASSGLELVSRISPDIPAVLVGDAGRLRQVLVNLVGNAIKFTSRGQVVVQVAIESQSPDALELHFSVTDTGIGIPAAKRQSIFQPFEQADGSTTRRYGGTGLGLAISGRLVALMGGWIWAESEVGTGSTFHFTARFGVSSMGQATAPAEAAAPVRVAAPVAARRLHVLLAEDNLVNQTLGRRLLEKRGHRVTVAGNGSEALAKLHEESFDLVLMDVQMPEMDGFEATGAIRAQERTTGAHLPIIAMTAHAMVGDQERCVAAGMDGYVSKPVSAQRVFDEIDRIVPAAREPREVAA